MSDGNGPWRDDREEPPARRPGLGPWLLILAAVGLLVLALFRLFPEAVRTQEDWTWLAYGLGLVVLVSAGVLRARSAPIAQHLKHAGIWLAIVAGLALGYAYRDELTGVGQRLRLAAAPGQPMATRERELSVGQGEDGSFVVVGRVNGQRIRFTVDTGASGTVLSPADARRLGAPMDSLDYRSEAETANGIGYGAPYVVDRLEVGPIALDDFPVTINKAPMSTSLLGMSFLRRLDSFEFRGRTLILRWKDGAARGQAD